MTRGAGIGPGIGPDVEDFIPVGTDREVEELEADWRAARDEASVTPSSDPSHAHELELRRRLNLSREAQERRLEYLAHLDDKTSGVADFGKCAACGRPLTTKEAIRSDACRDCDPELR